MNYKIIYKLVEGDFKYFEKQLNDFSDKGFVPYGNINTNVTETGVIYSQLISKTEPVKH